MDAKQHRDVMSGIRAALATGRLTPWQRSFLTDILGKYERYGQRTRLSAKQHAMLHRLIGEMLPEPPTVINFPPRRPRTQPRPRSKPWRPRRAVRQARMVGRQIALALIAVVGLFAIVGSLFQQGGDLNSKPEIGRSVVATSALDRPQISIIDGDTIRVAGQDRSIRLVGFNTPETVRARCSQERALGYQAESRLKQIVANGTPSVQIVQCACKPGTHGTDKCNFGRACGVLKVDGRDVGETLVAERLAVRFTCGATGCPPLPRPWCG